MKPFKLCQDQLLGSTKPFGNILTFGWGMDKMKNIDFSLKIGGIDAITDNPGGGKRTPAFHSSGM